MNVITRGLDAWATLWRASSPADLFLAACGEWRSVNLPGVSRPAALLVADFDPGCYGVSIGLGQSRRISAGTAEAISTGMPRMKPAWAAQCQVA